MAEILPVTDRFLPYVLEMVMSDAEEDGKSLAVILVVVKKASGVLLAVPANYFDEEILEGGQDAGPDELIGPSTTIRVPGGRLEQMNGPPPIAVPGAMVDLVLIDMHPDVLSQLVLVSEYDGPTELLHLFDEDPFVYPLRDELVAMTWDWIVQPTAGERVHYYSAAEEDQEEQELVPEMADGEQPAPTQPGPKAAGLPIGSAKTSKAL